MIAEVTDRWQKERMTTTLGSASPGLRRIYCYVVTTLMAFLVIMTLCRRLPRALEVLRAMEEADTYTEEDCLRDPGDIHIPKEWNLEDGSHLFITEDAQMLCKPLDGQWRLIDIDKLRRRTETQRTRLPSSTTPSA